MELLSAGALLAHLDAAGVHLVLTADSVVQVLAPVGVLTPRLRRQMRTHKAGLVALLQFLTHAFAGRVPAPVPSSSRRWVTGGTPGQYGTIKLEAPRYHDTPSPPVTYWGEPCLKKACATHVVDGKSHRYFPSGTCVSCWVRWDKRVTAPPKEEEDTR